jgi:Tol biopolymer transport system component
MKTLPLFGTCLIVAGILAGCSSTSTNSANVSTSTYLTQHGLLVLNDISSPGTTLDQVSIFTVRADGTGKKMLTGPGNQYPSWTPDGKIIFVSNRSGSPQIWIMDEDATNPKQIGNVQMSPITRVQMAKNGLIAFLHSGDGIWLMQKDGSGLRQLVKFANGAGDAPSLALSGTWLTFTSGYAIPGHNEIFRINTDGTGLKQLTFPTDPDYPDANASSISPDETIVAIYTGVESHPNDTPLTWGHRNIALIDSNGGARKLVTACQPVTTQQELQNLSPDKCLTSDNPSWSPDGQWIIYDRGSFNPDGSGTWAIDVNGKNIQRLNPAFAGGGNVPLKFTE